MTDYEKARARLYFRLIAHNAAVDALAAALSDPGIGKCPRVLRQSKPDPIAENERIERMMGRSLPNG